MPRLLLTLDSRRLTRQDTVKEGDIVLLHCTSARRHKFERAILARVDKIEPSRDSVNRVVHVSYFKASQCKLVGNKLVGSPTKIVRGLESLSMLNQDALNPCRVAEVFNHKCEDQMQIDEPQDLPTSQDDQNQSKINDHPQSQYDHNQLPPQDQLTVEQLDPSPLTMVWVEDQPQETNEQQPATQSEVQSQESNQDQIIVDQEFQQELQRQEQIDKKGDADYETNTLPDPQVPQRVTRSKNNIYKKNRRFEKDFI